MATPPQELLDLKFSADDCQVSGERHTGKKNSPRPLLFGVSNGEIPMDGPDFDVDDPLKAARRITVRHVPTGLQVSVDKFFPKRNREVAFKLLQRDVEKWIKDAIAKFESA